MLKVGEIQARGQQHPLSQPEAETCQELSLRAAVLGLSAGRLHCSHHKGDVGGNKAGQRARDRFPVIGSQRAPTSASLHWHGTRHPYHPTERHAGQLSACKLQDFVRLQTIKTPVLSAEKLMCCRVLWSNRGVDQALSFKNTVFYLYLFT